MYVVKAGHLSLLTATNEGSLLRSLLEISFLAKINLLVLHNAKFQLFIYLIYYPICRTFKHLAVLISRMHVFYDLEKGNNNSLICLSSDIKCYF